MSYNAIIVLGGGRNNQGNLTQLSTQRLDRGYELWLEGAAPLIFAMGGNYSTYSPNAIRFEQSGAQIRKTYLRTKGIPEDQIVIVEKGCRDTIGEAFESRESIRSLDLKKVLLITSDKHLERALFIFKRIFGKIAEIDGVGVTCGELLIEEEEKEYLKVAKEFFARFPEEIPYSNRRNWYDDHQELYNRYREIHDRYHPPGQESQAYMGVRTERR